MDIFKKMLFVAGFIGIYILGCGAIGAVFESKIAYIVWAVIEWKLFSKLDEATS